MIKVYSIPECSWCEKTKSYLKSKGIEYKDVNVQTDAKGREEMISLTGQQSIPVINIKGNTVIGFDRGKIDEYLAS